MVKLLHPCVYNSKKLKWIVDMKHDGALLLYTPPLEICGLTKTQGPEFQFTYKVLQSGFCMLAIYFRSWGVQKMLSELLP